MTFVATVKPVSSIAMKRRFGVLSTSALCSTAVVVALMQISSAIAADDNESFRFSPLNDTVKIGTLAPYVNPDGLILNMKAGDDITRLGPTGLSYDAEYGTTATFNGGLGNDVLNIGINGTLTVGGLTTIDNVEALRVGGTFNANGGLNLLGTAAGDSIVYGGSGALNVSGGNLVVSTGGGNDTFTTDPKGTIEVDGADAIFNGGTGDNTFNNNGHVATLNGGNITIDNFQNVTNTGKSFDAAGNFTFNGTGGSDTFTNNGALNAGGNGTFDFKASGDTFRNNGTITLTGNGLIDMGSLGDYAENAGSMTAANWTLDGGTGGPDQFFNKGNLTGGSIGITGFEFVNNDVGSKMVADVGGITITGGANDDTVVNSANALINSNTTFSVNLGGGLDGFTNSGKIVVQTGDVLINAGPGAGSQFVNDSGATMTAKSGNVDVSGFQGMQNFGRISASGDVDVTGTGFADTLSNTGTILAGGNASFVFGAGADLFSNTGGVIQAVGAGSIDLGSGADRLNNTAAMIAGSWDIDGGVDADVIDNSGLLSGGSIAVSGVETVTNSGVMRASTGGLSYTGTASLDSFTNQAAGVINSATAASFVFVGGGDVMTNDGLIVVGSGNASFDAVGAGNQLLNGGTIRTKGGDITIGGFQTLTNKDTLNASANIAHTGTALADSFTNNGKVLAGGNASFSFGGGADEFSNNDTMTLTGNGTVHLGTGADRLINEGTMEAASWILNGGADATDQLNNLGTITGGTIGIAGFESVINGAGGKLIASTGGVTYTGTDVADTFTNRSGAVVNSSTALSFNFGGGDDKLENEAGGLIAVQSGNATFNGGSGSNTFLNNGEVKTKAGDIVIKNFSTVTNNGNTFDASGNFTYDGTAGVDVFTNNGSLLAGGNGTFTFKAGNDTLLNSATGKIILQGDGIVSMGADNDTLTNQNRMRAANWNIDGGSGADTLTTGGQLIGGSIAISGFESVLATGLVRADTAGITYTGTGSADSLTVAGSAIVSSNTGAMFDFGAGDDQLTNGGLIVVKSGNATFEGGTGTNSFLNNGEVRTKAGDIVIGNFSTVTNNGDSSAVGNFVYSGTALADTFDNTGSVKTSGFGTFDGLGGADTLTNSGLMAFAANGTTFSNIESATNFGTMAFNIAGNAAGAAFTVNGDFTNGAGGDLDVQQGVYGDAIDINGIFTSVASASVMLDTRLTGATPATDILTADAASGRVNLDVAIPTSGSKGLLPGQILVVDTGGAAINAGVSFNGLPIVDITTGADAGVNISQTIGGAFDGGFVDYYIRNVGGDVYYESVLDADKAGGVAAGLASTVSSISAIFHKPISALVSRCKADDADGKGFGTWARASGGQLDTSSKGSYEYAGGAGDLSTENEVDYVGLQSGLDMASCDTGSGSTYHFGIMTGYMTGSSNQVGSVDRLSVDFDTKYLGVYATVIHESGFTGDATLRYDWHAFDLSHTDATAVAPNTEVDGSTFSGSLGASYTFAIGDSTSLRPAVGVLVGKTEVDTFDSPSGSFSFEDQMSVMATASLTAQHVIEIADSTRLVAFVSGNVFNEFGDNPQATIDIFGTDVSTEMDNVGTFGQVSAGLTLLEAADPGSTGPDMTGTLRFDAQFGEKLEGWGVTGQVRLQF